MATPIPQNQATFSFAEIIEATGARPNAAAARDPSRAVHGVATDSRAPLALKLFVALRGEHFDGHRFVEAAFTAGASAVLVEDEAVGSSGGLVPYPVFVVESSLDALGALARLQRRRWGGTVVAVGGSAGKTTTKNAVAALLSELAPGKVHVSPGNLNNRIGVPMVLFGVKPEHELLVVEIGTNVRGEVAALAAVAEPDIAVLTLIALEHAAGIGSLDAIELEEGDLLAHARVGVAIANGDDPRALRQLERSAAEKKLDYGLSEFCDYRILEREALGTAGTRFTFRRASEPTAGSLTTSLLGDPGAFATLAAIAVAEAWRGASLPTALLERVFSRRDLAEAGRLRPLELDDGTLLLDDSYNANPASMRAAIHVAQRLATQRSARLVLVLGEMRELGTFSVTEHTALAEPVKASGASLLIAVVGDAARLAAASRKLGVVVEFAASASEALVLCRRLLSTRDVALFKASHGVRLDTVVSTLATERGRAA